ncbi:MAG: threonine--tRNA ligase [Chloroflexota bacterium]
MSTEENVLDAPASGPVSADENIPAGYDPDLYKIRHSLAHVMAQAVLEMFPEGKVAIGPPIDDGFYYDFELPRPLTPDDLKAIEKRMRNILKKRHTFEYREFSAAEAKEFFADQPYKVELIEGLAGDEGVISTYKHDTFEDLCRGPHVEHLGKVNGKAFKLMSVAGAYWRGDENNTMLQRIYGTAWKNPADMKEYVNRMEEAKRRDHRKLGQELDLFSTSADEVGGGLVMWHPKGSRIRHEIEEFWRREHLDNDYELVNSPHIGRGTLWETSGHLDFYRDGMYAPVEIDGNEYFLKPMNCPFHILIYKSNMRSYRDFPIRYAEWGTVYRFERSGTLHGLLRVRGFTQDDAHHFVREDQMPGEIDFVLDFSLFILRSFGFEDFSAYLSTQPEDKYVGSDEEWRAAEDALRASLERAGLPYGVDEGGGAFYGPKIDLKIKDAIGREWQLSTIQFDFNLPERFDMTYIGQDGERHRPYMIHRALLGSLERFFGVLIEHYAGAFPVWLAPVQAMLIPITERHIAYADDVAAQFKKARIRVEVDASTDRMGNKIRKAQKQKIPFMLVIGDKEMESGQVAVRLVTGQDLGAKPVDDVIELIQKMVSEKTAVQQLAVAE